MDLCAVSSTPPGLLVRKEAAAAQEAEESWGPEDGRNEPDREVENPEDPNQWVEQQS